MAYSKYEVDQILCTTYALIHNTHMALYRLEILPAGKQEHKYVDVNKNTFISKNNVYVCRIIEKSTNTCLFTSLPYQYGSHNNIYARALPDIINQMYNTDRLITKIGED